MEFAGLKKMGKKHKKHKKRSHAHEGSGAMRVSFRLPGLPESRPPQSQWAHKELVTNPVPLELKVSIPWAALRKPVHMSSGAGEGGGESSEHRHHKHKHKKHKKNKHQATSDLIPGVPPVDAGHHGGSGFDQTQPPPPLQGPKVPSLMLPQVSSISPKQFYEHHKHREKHHHRNHPPALPQEHGSVPLTQPSQHAPPIPSFPHRVPQHVPPETSVPYLTPLDATHRHRHKKKKKHKHPKMDHQVRVLVPPEIPPPVPQDVPPQIELPYTQPISPLSDDDIEGDRLHSPLEDSPPSPKRSRTEDPPVTYAKPHYATLPVEPTQKPQSAKSSQKSRELGSVRLPEVDSLLPQWSLEAVSRSAYTEVPHPQPPPVPLPSTTGPSVPNPHPHQYPSTTGPSVLNQHPHQHPSTTGPSVLNQHPHQHPSTTGPSVLNPHPHQHPSTTGPSVLNAHPHQHPSTTGPSVLNQHPHQHPSTTGPSVLNPHPHQHPSTTGPSVLNPHPHQHPSTTGPSVLNPHQHPSTTGPSVPSQQLRPQAHVKLSRASLKFFLRNLHYQIQRRDPEGIFSDPVTDDIAPGYSLIIQQPMDLGTIGSKVQKNLYPSINEFKDDFVLMCNNAMTYNAPETVYYASAKNLLTAGLKIIAKETCLRPDIRYGKLSTPVNRSETVSPAPPADFLLPPATNVQLDYTSPFICRINLALLRSQVTSNGSLCSSPVMPTDQNDIFPLDIDDIVGEVSDQSHLTKVTVGVEDEGEGMVETPEEILMQVQEAAEEMKENLDTNYPGGLTASFLNRGPEGKTMLNILNPHSADGDVCKPVDLTALSERVRAGNNAATVLKTELPMFKATPVSYLMYGPFGSFAPVYDSTFATLTKMDSDLLLSTYGSELGVSYAHSLQQFVKGTGSFVSQMADAVLNGLTGGRHSDFMGKFRVFEEKERKVKESLRMEVRTPPREKGSPETKTGSAASSDGDQLASGGSSGDHPGSVASGDSGRDHPGSVASSDGGRDRPGSVASSDGGRDRPGSVASSDGGRDHPGSVASSDGGRDRSGSVASGGSSREQTPLGPEKGVENVGECSDMQSTEVEECGDMESPHKAPPSDASSNTQSQMSPCDIDGQLQHTSELISELQHHQLERLSRPPAQMSEGHFILPASSQEEISTASKLTQELAALTSQVTPADVVSVPTLHRAMGITLQPVEQSPASDRTPGSLHTRNALPST